MSRIVVKHIITMPDTFVKKEVNKTEEVIEKTEEVSSEEKKNKKGKKKEDMINEEQISAAEEQANTLASGVKVTKKDRSIIERAESSKIILTEDNRQILND